MVELETTRLRLAVAGPERAGDLARYFADNRDHFAPWDPPHTGDLESEAYWRRRLETHRAEAADGRSLRLWLFDRKSDRPIGTASFTEITRGALQACYLGYGIDRRQQGKGLMTEALRPAIDYVFGELRLHRIMANYMPENQRSGRLLQRLGFVREGLARRYLFINGAWRDHVQTSLINPVETAPELEAVPGA